MYNVKLERLIMFTTKNQGHYFIKFRCSIKSVRHSTIRALNFRPAAPLSKTWISLSAAALYDDFPISEGTVFCSNSRPCNKQTCKYLVTERNKYFDSFATFHFWVGLVAFV